MPASEINDIIRFILIIAGAITLYFVFFYAIKKIGKRKERFFPLLLNKYIYLPGSILFTVLAITFALPLLTGLIRPVAFEAIWHITKIISIGAVAFMLIRVLSVLREIAYYRYKKKFEGHVKYRKVKTQFLLIQRVLNSVLIIMAVIMILMTFPKIRTLGSTLLASAGVVGIILGFAAQRSLGTFFAGLQIAISQPIRIGDVVVVEGEFGTIGEINLTFVIIHTWDGRRRIVPINFFLEKSFETWNRDTPEIIGKVKIRTDYTIPVETLRQEVAQWLQESPLWDGRKWGFLVTDADDNSIQLRATMSAKNSDDAWDLECYIREKLITYIQQHYYDALPKTRIEQVS